jgi:serine/threonine-protein kinase
MLSVEEATPRSRLRELFDALVELGPEQRQARIAELDLTDELRVQLESMLAFDEVIELAPAERAGHLESLDLPQPVNARLRMMLAADSSVPAAVRGSVAEAIERICANDDDALGQSLIGTQIGNFRLLSMLGQGGSSAVFRAERAAGDGSQLVALKLLRTGLYSATEQRRFRREQALLAQLTHPNIAHLIEGGVSAAGIPYIAMELVDGLPITRAANVRGLDVEQRLHWFAKLCRTIEAAHAALIVHRDLKPSNLFVTADGELKVLDFGIAKLVDEDTHVTRTQSVAFTPGYAAPEQLHGGPLTTAVDVYALGVVLGELLTGQQLGGARRASDAVAADLEPLPNGLPPRIALVRRLRGDLDAILASALAEEPAMRFRSAGALADDVERHLDAKPVRAHPPSRWYAAQKFVRRHRHSLGISALLLLALITGTGIVAWQAHSLAREAQRARSTLDFLLHVFSAAEPAGPRLNPPTVADVVRASMRQVQQAATLQPTVRIELTAALGDVLRKQGDLKGSLQLLEQNHREAVAALGASDPTTLLAGLALAQAQGEAKLDTQARLLLDTLLQQGRSASAELRARLLALSAEVGADHFERERALQESAQALALCTQQCDERTRILTLITRGNVLAAFQDDPAAIAVLEQAATMQRRVFGGPHVEIADTLEALSRAYRRTGRLERAESLARESLAIAEASLPDPHQRRVSALDSLRQVLMDSGKFEEAIALGLRIIAMDEVIFGPAHTSLATDENTLGYTYSMRGDFELAAQHFRIALAIAEQIPDNARRRAIYQANLGQSIGHSGNVAEGQRLIRNALSRFQAQSDIDYSEVTSALEKLGDLQRESGDLQSALATFEQADAIYRKRLPTAPSEWHARTLIGIGRTLSDAGADIARAESELRAAIAKTSANDKAFSPLRIEAQAALADLLYRKGDRSAARQLLDGVNAQVHSAQRPLPYCLAQMLQQLTARI